MFKQSIIIFSAFICASAKAAVFINPAPFISADMTVTATPTSSSAVNVASSADFLPASTIQSPSANTFQFELESAGVGWGGVNFAPGLTGGKLGVGGTFSFEVASGYQITQLYGAMAGAYDLDTDSKLQAYVQIDDGFHQQPVNTLEIIGGAGAWTSSFLVEPYAAGTTTVSGSFYYYLNGQPDYNTNGYGEIIGLNNPSSNYGANGYGPSIFVTVEQIASAVPEPSEWALLLAGLGLVSAIAKRRKHRYS
jgi:hypothetical protein